MPIMFICNRRSTDSPPRRFRDLKVRTMAKTIIKLFDGSMGLDEAFFRCDLSQASSPVEHFADSSGWDSTQYQCADCKHRDSGLADVAKRLAATYCEDSDFDCEWEVVELGYKISDGNATENADNFDEAVEVIVRWYEDLDSWADGNGDADRHEAIREAIDSVEQPEDGGLDALNNYAGSICTAIAEKLGGKAFHGHGNYAVSAASQIGMTLNVTEITDPS